MYSSANRVESMKGKRMSREGMDGFNKRGDSKRDKSAKPNHQANRQVKAAMRDTESQTY